jgi:hypothetical protein
MAFMRSYAMMAGDPLGRMLPKRKQAYAGPRVKASRKAQIRIRRSFRYQGDPFLGMAPAAAAAAAPAMGKALRGLKGAAAGIGSWLGSAAGKQALGKLAGVFGMGGPGALPKLSPGITGISLPGAVGAGGGGGGRRSMNVANVKALRRSLRRLEGFKNLVKRVDKLMPSGAKIRSSSSSRPRGHKRGCRCATCR